MFFESDFYVQENSMMEEESEDIEVIYHQMQGGQTDLCWTTKCIDLLSLIQKIQKV